ncbi:MAG: hypothetical protein KIH01_05605 [Candidatus Freyarchaeota archaeon]|nr:hypothetical protein [Candidatus Jordarchaeia archaeon]
MRGFEACEPQGLSMDQHLPILSLEPSLPPVLLRGRNFKSKTWQLV